MSSVTESQPQPPEAASQAEPAAAPQVQSESQPPLQAAAHSEKRPPLFKWSHPTGSGRIDIAVWDKTIQTDSGERVLYHVTCQRSYRRQQDGGYENTGIFWHTDLLVLAHGLQVVFDRIKELQRGEPF